MTNTGAGVTATAAFVHVETGKYRRQQCSVAAAVGRELPLSPGGGSGGVCGRWLLQPPCVDVRGGGGGGGGDGSSESV